MPSTVITYFTYDPIKSILRVIFVTGTIYDYLNVPKEVYGAMKRSASKGALLNKYIKGNYAFIKRE
jgi:hypothetical protein